MSLPAFAALLERLAFTPGRNAKLALLRQWFATQPDPDRGVGLAALTGELSLRTAKPALVRELAASRSDPVLFDLSYDYVGDLAETVALIWVPRAGVNAPPPSLAEVVEKGFLDAAQRAEAWAGLDATPLPPEAPEGAMLGPGMVPRARLAPAAEGEAPGDDPATAAGAP